MGKRTQKANRDAAEKYRLIVENASEAISIAQDGLLKFLNPKAEKLMGYGKEELLSKPFSALIHPDDRQMVVDRHFQRLAGKPAPSRYAFRIITKEGSVRWVEINTVATEWEDRPATLFFFDDVTERRQTEEALALNAEKLRRSNLELQSFASIASHDLQEPLRKIQAFGNLLEKKYAGSLNEQGRDYLDRMKKAAERMQALISDLLAFSRVTTKVRPFVRVNLTSVLREALSNLETRLQDTGGRVETEDLPTIQADPVQMMQLFLNLIGNALKFHREDEPPVVKITAEILKSPVGPSGTRGRSGDVCRITVEDNGIGFDEKHLETIFLPFERLHGKSAYEGTGMGLAICRKIVERHGGEIRAQSEPGKGSRFIIELPISQPDSS